MPESSSFRQTDEKHVSVEIELMEWSPKMDLIAVSNVQGEVVLHRLSWQKVWTRTPPTETVRVTALTWRTDGKVLAVSYSSGTVILCNVENSSVLHQLDLSSEVTSLNWICETMATETTEPEKEEDQQYKDRSSVYLPKLPQLSKGYGFLSKGQSDENVEDAKKLNDQKSLNVLIIGTSDSHVQLFAFGVFPIGVLNLTQHSLPQTGRVEAACLSQDVHVLSIVVQNQHEDTQENKYHLLTFECTLLAMRCKEIKALALKYGQLVTLLEYVQATIKQMSEAWEGILLEMDSKLTAFAEEKFKLGSGTVSNDFLELLLFGTPSAELQMFLLHKLTEKDLRKLGLSIETSYSNIQKLVLGHLQSVTQAVIYHLNDMRGMSLWYDRFGVLGLATQSVQEAITAAGTFMLKAVELQQVIDGSMKNLKAFFRWLYVVIQRLSNEQIPPEVSKMTQQDMNFVADFLKENFTQEMDGLHKSGFKLERVGQYLKNEDLQHPPDNSNNQWVQFLETSTHAKDSFLLYPSQPTKSLVQLEDNLKQIINSALRRPAAVIGQSLQCNGVFPLCEVQKTEQHSLHIPKISQYSLDHFLYTAFIMSEKADRLFLVRHKTRMSSSDSCLEAVAMRFGQLGPQDGVTEDDRCTEHKILDLSMYNDKTISVLLVEDREDSLPVLAQVPLSAIEEDKYVTMPTGMSNLLTDNASIEAIDVGPHIDHMNYRKLENMKAHSFAVSGTRKVACVLFSSRRRVRLFLMDVEDEEDEDEDDEQDTSKNHSHSNTDSSRLEGVNEEDKENTSHETSDLMDT